ncbi:MAG: hypothetical protein V7731_07555 [Amphritea sp.]
MMRLIFIIAVLTSTISAYLLILKAICFVISVNWMWLDFYSVAYLFIAVAAGYGVRLAIEATHPEVWGNLDNGGESHAGVPGEQQTFSAREELHQVR